MWPQWRPPLPSGGALSTRQEQSLSKYRWTSHCCIARLLAVLSRSIYQPQAFRLRSLVTGEIGERWCQQGSGSGSLVYSSMSWLFPSSLGSQINHFSALASKCQCLISNCILSEHPQPILFGLSGTTLVHNFPAKSLPAASLLARGSPEPFISSVSAFPLSRWCQIWHVSSSVRKQRAKACGARSSCTPKVPFQLPKMPLKLNFELLAGEGVPHKRKKYALGRESFEYLGSWDVLLNDLIQSLRWRDQD